MDTKPIVMVDNEIWPLILPSAIGRRNHSLRMRKQRPSLTDRLEDAISAGE